MVDGMKDKIAGKAKEVAGEVSQNKDLKAEGKADQVAGKVKDFAEDVKGKAEQAGEDLKAGVDKLKKEFSGE